jgi:ubiquinone/menaquinone biosynthesis C-methylase UbiE
MEPIESGGVPLRIPYILMNSFSESFAKVPSHLVAKVNGDTTESGFLYIGKCVADTIEAAVGAEFLKNSQSILDFGCGLGRVSTQLLQRAPSSKIVGFDIDPLMLEWAEKLLPENRAKLVHSTLNIPDEQFDLIIVISVFTHLDRTTDFWLTELHRLIRPNGKIFVTYQDDTLFTEMLAKQQIPNTPPEYRFQDKFIVGEHGPEGGAGMGTFYSTKYWESLLNRYFNIATSKPRGQFGHQSYSVISKKQIQIDRTKLLMDYAFTVENELHTLRKDNKILY